MLMTPHTNYYNLCTFFFLFFFFTPLYIQIFVIFHMDSVKILTLNVRGLLDDRKRFFVFNFLRKQQADIICLTETHATATVIPRWQQEWAATGPSAWTHHTSAARGVAILINKKFTTKILTTISTDPNSYFIHTSIENLAGGSLRLLGIYAPNNSAERRALFSELLDDLSNEDEADDILNYYILGDFNCVHNTALDKVGGNPANGTSAAAELQDLCDWLNVSDAFRTVYPAQVATTWRATTADGSTMGTRIDRIYVPNDFDATNITCAHLPVTFEQTPFDHDAVLATVTSAPTQRGKGYWKLNTSILNHDAVITAIRTRITNLKTDIAVNDDSVFALWSAFKRSCKSYFTTYSQQQSRAHSALLDAAQHDHSAKLAAWEANPTAHTSGEMHAARVALDGQLAKQYRAASLRIQSLWLDDGEKPSKFFCSLEKTTRSQQCIASLQHPVDQDLRDTPAGMCSAAAAFYSTLYTPETAPDQAALLRLAARVPQLTADQVAMTEAPLSLHELFDAAASTPKGRTPGLDGLPIEFYLAFWGDIGPVLLQLFRECVQRKLMPGDCSVGVISLLYKKGDKSNVANYRPLTLITSDTKLLSKLLSKRLDQVIASLVHTDQSGFIRGRYIHNNTALARAVQDMYRSRDDSAAIAFLDQEKAFDRVNWVYRDAILRAYGFGPLFLDVVQTLHTNLRAVVSVNGHHSGAISILRGTRQGDPFSPGLYALMDEPLAIAIREDPLYRGISPPNNLFGRAAKIALYADDKALYFSTPADADRALVHIHDYELASGARVNKAKSKLLLLGQQAVQADWGQLQLPILQPGESVTYLGVPMGPTVTDLQIWSPKVQQLTKIFALWRHRSLSHAGRVTVLKTLATSVLWYIGSVVDAPAAIVSVISRLCWRFLWRDRARGMVNQATALLPRAKGGLSMVDAPAMLGALQVAMLRRFLDSSDYIWKDFVQHQLESCPAARQWSLGLRIIGSDVLHDRRHQGPSDPFWSNALHTATRLHLQERKPTLLEHALAHHLLRNPAVRLPTAMTLRDPGYATAAVDRGIQRFGNLVRNDLTFKDHTELGMTATRYEQLCNSIPDHWMTLLAGGRSALVAGEWCVASRAVLIPAVYRITTAGNDICLCDVFIPSASSVFAPLSPPTQHDQPVPTPSLLRAFVTIDTATRTGVCHGPLDVQEVLPDRLRLLQSSDRSLQPLLSSSVSATRAALTAAKAPPTPDLAYWRTALGGSLPSVHRIWSWVWASYRQPKVRDLLWRLLHRRLPLQSVRSRFTDESADCPVCTNHEETFVHFVHECTAAKVLWTWFVAVWSTASDQVLATSVKSSLLCSLPARRVRVAERPWIKLLSCLHGEIIYAHWIQRVRFALDNDAGALLRPALVEYARQRCILAVDALRHSRRHRSPALSDASEFVLGALNSTP